MTTMGQALTAVRIRLDEATATAWSDAEIRGWINEGVTDIARRTEAIIKTAVLAVSANSATTAAFPTDLLRITRAELFSYAGGTEFRKLEIREFNEMDPTWHSSRGQDTGTPLFLGIAGYPPFLTGTLYPIPQSSGSVNLTYYSSVTPLSTTSSDDAVALSLPTGWESLAYEHATYLALRRDGQSAEWQASKQIYEEMLNDMIDMTRHYHDQPQQIVPDLMSDPYMYGQGWF